MLARVTPSNPSQPVGPRRRSISELDGWEIVAAHEVKESHRRVYYLLRKGRQAREVYLCVDGKDVWLEVV